MSVYIKSMKMPTSCYACMFFAQTNYWNKEDEADILSHCKRTGEKTWESVNGYLPNCPLVPVPDHGRLGDLDKLAEKIHECWEAYHADAFCEDFLDEMPTIIPADKEDGE